MENERKGMKGKATKTEQYLNYKKALGRKRGWNMIEQDGFCKSFVIFIDEWEFEEIEEIKEDLIEMQKKTY